MKIKCVDQGALIYFEGKMLFYLKVIMETRGIVLCAFMYNFNSWRIEKNPLGKKAVILIVFIHISVFRMCDFFGHQYKFHSWRVVKKLVEQNVCDFNNLLFIFLFL